MAKRPSESKQPRLIGEPEIERYKAFFRQHLMRTQNRDAVLKNLFLIKTKHEDYKSSHSPLLRDTDREQIEQEASAFLKAHLGAALSDFYEQEAPSKLKAERNTEDGSFWATLVVSLGEMFKDIEEKRQANWKRKTQFLNSVYSCLYYYGLHPAIHKRDAASARFHVLLTHFHNSKTQQLALLWNLTRDELDDKFLRFYAGKKPILIKGLLIPFGKIHEVKITSSLLKDDEVELFALTSHFDWNSIRKDEVAYARLCHDETEALLPNPYANEVSTNAPTKRSEANELTWLAKYPDALKHYQRAVEGLSNGSSERHIVDDLRLAFELFLRQLLGNKKSLENQLSEVGTYLKQKGASSEIVQWFRTTMDIYTKYQNNNVKHDDNVKSKEVPRIIEMTTTLMKFIAEQ